MMPKVTAPEIFLDLERTTAGGNAGAWASEAAMRTSARQLVVRLARLDLDAGTLEMLTAALAADVCDQVAAADVHPES